MTKPSDTCNRPAHHSTVPLCWRAACGRHHCPAECVTSPALQTPAYPRGVPAYFIACCLTLLEPWILIKHFLPKTQAGGLISLVSDRSEGCVRPGLPHGAWPCVDRLNQSWKCRPSEINSSRSAVSRRGPIRGWHRGSCRQALGVAPEPTNQRTHEPCCFIEELLVI